MCGWLDRIGYTSLASGWTRNNGRLAPLAAQTAERLAAAVRQYGGPATLIGHSFGGVVARKVAREHPDLVRQVITMGSPLGVDANPLNRAVPLTAIYSRTDRIVRYPRALTSDSGHNIEIAGCHCGMAVNAQVYRHLADQLQSPPS